MNKTKAAIVLLLVSLFGFTYYFVGDQLVHNLWTIYKAYFVPALLLTILLVVFLVAIYKDKLKVYHTVSFLAIIAVIFGLVPYGFTMNYSRLNQYDDHTVTSEKLLEYRDRAPYDVATATSNRNLGDTTGESTGGVKSIPAAGEHGVYTTSIVRRGIGQGYESTQTMDIPLFGAANNKNITFCDFNEENKLRFGGMLPVNNLTRAIYQKTPASTKVIRSDAFVVCQDGAPIVYAPIVQLKGFWFGTWVPYGVATYNGKTGELKIHEEMVDTGLPVYPQSIAQKQRVSNRTGIGMWDYYVTKRAGYEDTSRDDNDPNGNNRSDFGLSRDGDSYFVSPLTSRGSSTSIVALGEINSSTVKRGELNPYTIYKYDSDNPRQANSSIAQRITGGILEGYKSQNLTVFEIVPNEDNTWVATIGNDQNIQYRAIIKDDNSITLEKDTVGEVPESSEQLDVQLDKDFSEMTNEELKQAMNTIIDEIISRSGE